MALMCAIGYAVPAKRGIWKTVTTADGSTVRVELRGDEFCHYWRAADGRCYVENAGTGLFETANVSALLKAGEPRRAAAEEARQRRAPMSRVQLGGDHAPYTGEKKGLIILVSFADRPFEAAHTQALYDRIANEENFSDPSMGFVGSVHDYFRDQSYGQFSLKFDVVGPVAMPENQAYYGGNVNGQDNMRVIGQMVKDACSAVADEVDFNDYDWDGDGEVDQVFILYAGRGEASGGGANTIWPHEYNLTSATGSALTINGVRINTYACGCELGAGGGIDGIGTICHEFSHCLGLPDMYDTRNDNSLTADFGLGEWGLMSAGNYNGNSFIPAGYTSYEKMYAGWLTPTVLESDRTVSGMRGINDNQDAYIVYNDGHTDEYYLLENHDGSGWDAGLPGTGLLILHVDFDEYIWAYNIVNSPIAQSGGNPHPHCTIIPADGTRDANQGDLWPYSYHTSLTNTSSPAAELYNLNSNGSYLMNKPITNITKASDGTISFSFANENISTDDYPLPETYIFYESFDQCNGSGGNDGNFNVNTSGSVVYDNQGWTSTSSQQADRCARYGSSMMTGQATTPEITINGTYNLWFKAAPYGSDGTTMTVEVAQGDATLGKTSFTMSVGKWSAFNTTVEANGVVKLRFMTDKGRFYLDKVCITAENIGTGIADVNVDADGEPADNRIYSIDGRYVGADETQLPKGLYIRDGKKFVKK